MNDKRNIGFTDTQGQYLSFIYNYSVIHGRPPAEADLARFFGTTPPSIHQMILNLEQKELISRVPGQARSIRLLIAPEALPILKAKENGDPTSPRTVFSSRADAV